jgi:2-polyprenyl-3-methyl-5-hydroxy-6-metoxy-1,4-benzoquinol methylase
MITRTTPTPAPLVARATPDIAVRSTHAAEVRDARRFEFGANWAEFLRSLTPQRVEIAVASLRTMLGVQDLRGKRFLDIGSGSGLFSLAARRLGATVHSFDYDPQSVQCTAELKRRDGGDDAGWTVEEASVLDHDYLAALGQFDVVYSWGVLHHTGDMWTAVRNAVAKVAPEGRLFIALYNDQGSTSRRWRALKRIYNRLPRSLRPAYAVAVMGPRELRIVLGATLSGKLGAYLDNRRNYAQRSLRGMSYWHDLIDWIGGYPFEVSKPEEVFSFCRDRGLRLLMMRTCGGQLGCNEFVFEKAG